MLWLHDRRRTRVTRSSHVLLARTENAGYYCRKESKGSYVSPVLVLVTPPGFGANPTRVRR